MPRKEGSLRIGLGQPPRLRPPFRRSRKTLDPSQPAELTLVVRSRKSDEEWRTLVAEVLSGFPGKRRYLTHAELPDWGASPEDIKTAADVAGRNGLQVVSTDPVRRCVVVAASLEQHSRAFGVEFFAVDHPLGTFRSYTQAAGVPAAASPLIECILGLHNLPAAETHAAPARKGRRSMDREALLAAYRIPTRLSGKGQCVAIIELGGGYHESDLVRYFEQFGLDPPRVRTRGIAGAKNIPAPPDMIREFFESLKKNAGSSPAAGIAQADATSVQWTFETTTDLAMVGTIAPGVSILLVQTTNDDQGQYHALTSVVTDAKDKPSVLSCSWGGPESGKNLPFLRTMDRWFQLAAALGMTVCCSSGDFGDGSMSDPPKPFTIQFPASSPHVLACGGTTLRPKAGIETAWKQKMFGSEIAGGGGFSDRFPMPPWQRAAGIDPADWIPDGVKSGKGRAIPDVAAKANMDPAYSIIVGGIEEPAGGTSAAAPLWAGVAAILNEGLNARIGSLNALLYEGALRAGLRDIVAGNTAENEVGFYACKGWDACTGWGSPKGEALLAILRD
jgi:kumamolisin